MVRRRTLLAGLLVGLMVAPSYAQMVGTIQDAPPVVEKIAEGQVNWTVGTVRASGIGAPPAKVVNQVQALAMAERAAVTVARRNLLEVIKGVRVDSETLVENFITTSDVIRTSISGIIQGARVVDRKNLAGGGVEVVMEIKLHGEFAESVLPEKQFHHLQIPEGKPEEPKAEKHEEEAKVAPVKIYTGLVVDARGINIRPAMAPKIVNERGEEIYGSAYVSRDYAIQQGMAGYSRDLEKAEKNERVTDTPIIVKGLKSSGHSKSDIVISNADGETLQAAAKNLKFIQQCKVIIVVD